MQSCCCTFVLFGGCQKGLKELPHSKSKTDQPMRWNQPSKKVVPRPLSRITFNKLYHGKEVPVEGEDEEHICRSSYDPRAPRHRNLDIQAFQHALLNLKAEGATCGVLQFWEDEPKLSSMSLTHHEQEDVNGLVLFSHV